MISDNPTYVFDKVKAKIEMIQQHLKDAEELCDFALSRKVSMSDDTYAGLKRDALASLQGASELLEETIMIGNCNTST